MNHRKRGAKPDAPQGLAQAKAELPNGVSTPCGYLIRIRQKKQRERAIAAFLCVREARVTFPGDVMGVTAEHIDALREEGIPFEYLSKAPNGGRAAAQSERSPS